MLPKTLTAIYDFAVSPLSYDFVYFLSTTRIAKGMLGCERVHIVYVPANTPTGFRIDSKPTTTKEKIWRRDHLIVPMARLLDATHTVCATRNDTRKYLVGDVWPPKYGVQNRTAAYFYPTLRKMARTERMPPFHTDKEVARLVSAWAGPRKYLTITHRRTYAEARNSNAMAWAKFGQYAQEQGWGVINIPDTQEAGTASVEPLGAIAAINPLVRHALYAGAAMNLGVNTGPMALCHCGALPYLTFKMEADYHSTTPEFLASIGLPVGSQHPWANPVNQRLIWKDDEFETIQGIFDEIMAGAGQSATTSQAF